MATPKGGKLWRLAYRFAGKQKTLALGSYPVVTLQAARDAQTLAKRQLAEGIDPSEAKKVEKRQQRISAENTFEAVATEYCPASGLIGQIAGIIWRRILVSPQ